MGTRRKHIIALWSVAAMVGLVRAEEPWEQAPIAHKSPCGCEDAFGPCVEPKVQFTLDGLLMWREKLDRQDLLFNSNNGNVLFRTDEMLTDPEGGVRIGLIVYGSEGGGLEFSYFGLDEFGNTVTREANAPIVFPFFGGFPANPGREYSVMYKSTLSSGELNLRQRLSRVNVLAGFRFVELNERFTITRDTGGFFSGTDNDMYGFQLGGDACLLNIKRSVVFSSLKAGVYYNDADVTARAALPNGSPIRFTASDDQSSFVGDLALGLLIPMGPAGDFRIAYQGLFLDGVGLAPNQSNTFSLFTGEGALDTSSVLYHGGFIGIDLFW